MVLYVEAGYELADLGTYVLDVVETGGNTFTVTLATGTHFLTSTAASATGDFSARVTGYTSLLTAIDAALEAGGAGTNAYTVAFSKTTERVTITHDGTASVTAISLTATTNGGLIGHTTVQSAALTHEMDVTPEHWISGDVGFWSDFHEQESDEDIGFTTRAQDGTAYGVAKDGVATFLDMTVALEPRASVYNTYSAASDPYTWQDFFKHVRNVYPVAIYDGTTQHFVKLRRPAFRPLRRSADYVGHFDIRLESELLARI
jgi:hypothetical protein